MFAELQNPDILTASELDAYLERGWFRMGQSIFTTNFLSFKGELYSALWLKVDLINYQTDKTFQKLSKLNSKFSIEIKPLVLDEEKDLLFSVYKESVAFEPSSSLHQLMYRESIHDIFNTLEINIRDEGKLIASGFFDIGKNSAAGITSFYHPDYKKYSLGKFLIYSKINYCKKKGLHFFYPGYFVPGYPAFDYKLSIASSVVYFLDYNSQQWKHIDQFDPSQTPLQLMRSKLTDLQLTFEKWGMFPKLMKYDFFDANLIPGLQGLHLFDVPLILYPFDTEEEIVQPVIIYDVRDEKFHLLKCISVWRSNYIKTEGVYAAHLLKVETDLLSETDPEEFISVIVSSLSSDASSFTSDQNQETNEIED